MRTPMRYTLLFAGTLAVALLAVAPAAFADDKRMEETTTTTTTTTSQGTVTQIAPNAIVIKSAESPTPIMISRTRTTTYVDEDGNPVKVETVKSGEPVTVYYDENGGKMVATKVVVKKRMIKEDD